MKEERASGRADDRADLFSARRAGGATCRSRGGLQLLAVSHRGVSSRRSGARGDLLLKWWDGTRWSDYAPSPESPDESYPAVTMPAPLTGPPAACSWGGAHASMCSPVDRASGDLVHKWWDGSDWSGFDSLGMPCGRSPLVLPRDSAVGP